MSKIVIIFVRRIQISMKRATLMKHSIILSNDGSHTLKLSDFDECYHSSNGACAEAFHIYIKCGCDYLWNQIMEAKLSGQKEAHQNVPEQTLSRQTAQSEQILSGQQTVEVYDIGLGTALNAMVTLVWQQQLLESGKPVPHIRFKGIEKYPIPAEEALTLNFPQHIAALVKKEAPSKINEELLAGWFTAIHTSEWEKDIQITPYFTLHKHQGDLLIVDGSYFRSGNCNTYDSAHPALVMYDTFSPATQPQLWDVTIFRKIAQNVAPGSILTTYCSKGTVKQALRDAGFQLERLSGPPGKRHILRASIR